MIMEHEGCKDCKFVDGVTYKDNTGSHCIGIIQKKNKPIHDVIRYCELDKKELRIWELHLVEALNVSSMTARAVIEYLAKVDLKKLQKEIKNNNLKLK